MTPEQWRRVEEVFQAALELASSEQVRFLEKECAGDPTLRDEVESLLASLQGNRGQIEGPIQGAAQDFAARQDAALIGRRIGPYKITGLLGHGGMGSVYKAVRVDEEFVKEVAIKIVRQGMDTGFIRERFIQERQILAQLDHPHITRLLDGGTTDDGLPYLVMEYVEGKPITEFCAARKLGINQRLQLVLQICAAVQHAHRNLVVHRDLKPGNILVTDGGTPKLLDFGIAKILSADPGHTGPLAVTVIRMMTPEYSSPEQVLGAPVTAATDVYALGAILYELLSMQKAHRLDSNSPIEIERVVVRQEPPPPSVAAESTGQPLRWRRQLEGDLDNIVLNAMRKEPERRYNSAEQMAQDIQNHLTGLPVMARPNTLRYRAAKFVTRNRLPLALATLLFVSLVAGIVATSREAARSNRRFQEMRGLAHTILFDVHDKLQSLPGSTEARALMITKVAGYLDNLSREAAFDLGLRRELAEAYEKIGDVQGSPYFPNLGRTDQALESYRKARDNWIVVANGSSEPDQEVLIGLSRCFYRVGDARLRLGERDAAIENFKLGLERVKSIKNVSDAGSRWRALAGGHHRLGDALLAEGKLSEGYDQYRQARHASEQLVALEPGPRSRFLLAASLLRNGDALTRLGDLDAAEAVYRAGVQTREEIVREQPDNTANRRELIPLYNALGNLLGHPDYPNLNRPSEAMDRYKQSFAIAEAGWHADPKSAQSRYDLAISHTKLGTMLVETNPGPAATHLDLAASIYAELAAADPRNVTYRRNRVYVLARKARALTAAGRHEAAHQSLMLAQDLGSRLLQSNPKNGDVRHEFSGLLLEMAQFHMAGQNYTTAVDIASQAISHRAPEVVTGRDSLSLIDTDSRDKELLAKAYEGIGSPAALEHACRAWKSTDDIWREWSGKGIASSYSRRRKEEASRSLQLCQQKLEAALQRSGKKN